MFAAARLVDAATSNDDRPIPDSTLREAVSLCQSDPANVSKLVRSCISKLTNSFVMVRIKALALLIHAAQHGPPSVTAEVAQHTHAISASRGWRGEPHPVRGFEPYDAMREAADLLLSLTRAPAPKSRFAKSSPSAPAPAPPPPAAPAPAPAPAGPSVYAQPQRQRQQTGAAAVGAAISGAVTGAVDTVTGFFKKSFARRGEFSTFDDARAEPVADPTVTSFVPMDSAPAAPLPSPAATTRDLSGGSLLGYDEAPSAPRAPARGSGLRAVKKPQAPLTPAKKLLKVTGGRAMANPEELRAFHDSLALESIPELVEGLDDAEWKVKVRAILGLELAGERYGLPAVAHAKKKVLGLTSAPQASLRTAAGRFYEAIKEVKPGPPEEKSAFSFIAEAAEEPPDDGGFTFGEEAPPEEAAPLPQGEEAAPLPQGEEALPQVEEALPQEEAPPAEAEAPPDAAADAAEEEE